MKSHNSSSSTTRGGGGDDDKKLASIDRGFFSTISPRNLILWSFLIISMLYILYSSNLLLNNDLQDCNTTTKKQLSESETEHERELLPMQTNSTNSIMNLQHHQHQHQHQQEEVSKLQEDEQEQEQEEKKRHTKKKEAIEEEPKPKQEEELSLKHIVFCIAGSSNLWEQRKEYIKLWWRPNETRGIVWLDEKVKTRKKEGLPEIRISGNTSQFPYTHRTGSRAALRITRVVSEALRSGIKDVRWFVMGDDDTVFVVENVVRVLSKYDHNQFYYVGCPSESHVQNIIFSYNMAFGGGGFAISYPLAKELEKMQDRCITRYPGLYGSDDRIHACMSELGVPLTKELGFHQYDVYGNLLGLLGAHPVAPLVSMHHLDVVDPVFPQMPRAKALQHLFQSINLDSASIMQQSICYDKQQMWSISVSWGFVVQIIRGVISPRELEMPTRTFLNWYQRGDYTSYAFNTRPVTKHPCQKPFIFYMRSVRYDKKNNQILGVYARHPESPPPCRWKMTSPETIDSIVVTKKPDPLRWKRSPRRDCCRVLPSKKSGTMYLSVGNCREGEISEL